MPDGLSTADQSRYIHEFGMPQLQPRMIRIAHQCPIQASSIFHKSPYPLLTKLGGHASGAG